MKSGLWYSFGLVTGTGAVILWVVFGPFLLLSVFGRNDRWMRRQGGLS